MAKKDDKSNSEQKEPKKERRFSQEQYEMLLRCSEKKDMTEWNEWRKENRKEDVLLEGANLSGWNLKGVSLSQVGVARITPERFTSFIGGEVYLSGAEIRDADLEKADFRSAHLENAKLNRAHLEGAKFLDAHLEGAIFYRAHLEGANLQTTIVDGETSFWECEVDCDTDFRGVGLGSCRIDPGTRQLLKYNVRRLNWEKWYKEHRFWRWPVQVFWLMSDYGMSTVRVVGVFFLLAFLFAGIYMNCAYWRPPGIIDNLIVETAVEQEMSVVYYFWLALVRPIYFSIVTMTTLGFGDMYANKGSIAGHVILALQVILGYVLLGALITRFAVLFTTGGPAGKFEEQKKKVDSVSPDNGIRGQASTE